VKARRYQLRKDAVSILMRGNPWLFREQMSSAAQVFPDGQWLRLYDHANTVIGHGIYEAEGAIAIRLLRRGDRRPDADWVQAQVLAAIDRRRALAARTDGMRLVHGESDGLPAVVIDRFGDGLVAQSYSAGTDGLARYAAIVAQRILMSSRPVTWICAGAAHRRRDGGTAAQPVAGTPPAVATFREDGRTFAVDLAGQKTGTYLDLRGLRATIAALPLAGARVLNLFAYTGMLGAVAEGAGAAHVTQVDTSASALAFAAAHHVTDASRHTFVTADVFDWLPALAPSTFDLVIVDPPAMTSKKLQIPAVLAAYKKLYVAAAPHVALGGLLVAACCTSRIERAVFQRTVRDALGAEFAHEGDLPPELDHPVGFPQADYLKIGLWRRVPRL
jgi:23S rRNA (cytosine1962-C5)-methyltransferase